MEYGLTSACRVEVIRNAQHGWRELSPAVWFHCALNSIEELSVEYSLSEWLAGVEPLSCDCWGHPGVSILAVTVLSLLSTRACRISTSK